MKVFTLFLFVALLVPVFSQVDYLRDDFVYVNRTCNIELPDSVAAAEVEFQFFRQKFWDGYGPYTPGMQAETRLSFHLDNGNAIHIWSYYYPRINREYLFIRVPGSRRWQVVRLPKETYGIEVQASVMPKGQGGLTITSESGYEKELFFNPGRATKVEQVSVFAYIALFDIELINSFSDEQDFSTVVNIQTLVTADGETIAGPLVARDRFGNLYQRSGSDLPMLWLSDGDSSSYGDNWFADDSIWRMSICIHDD